MSFTIMNAAFGHLSPGDPRVDSLEWLLQMAQTPSFAQQPVAAAPVGSDDHVFTGIDIQRDDTATSVPPSQDRVDEGVVGG